MAMLNQGAPPLPVCTLSVIILCGALQVYVFLIDPPFSQVTLSPVLVIYGHQFWRIITSAFFHGGFMHIAMNMMSIVSLGGSFERTVGSVMMAFTLAWQILLSGISNVLLSWFLSLVLTGDMKYIKQQSVGFSGVIFALCVVDIYRGAGETRSIFGFFEVPAKVYPWVLLIMLQFLIPNVSFMGHLSGILTGTIQAHGGLNCLLPSVEMCRLIEAKLMGTHPRYILTPNDATIYRESLFDLG